MHVSSFPYVRLICAGKLGSGSFPHKLTRLILHIKQGLGPTWVEIPLELPLLTRSWLNVIPTNRIGKLEASENAGGRLRRDAC